MQHVSPAAFVSAKPADAKSAALRAFDAATASPAGADWRTVATMLRACLATTRRKLADAIGGAPMWWQDYKLPARGDYQRDSLVVRFADDVTVRCGLITAPGKAPRIAKACRVAIAFYRGRMGAHAAVPEMVALDVPATGATFDPGECSRLTAYLRAAIVPEAPPVRVVTLDDIESAERELERRERGCAMARAEDAADVPEAERAYPFPEAWAAAVAAGRDSLQRLREAYAAAPIEPEPGPGGGAPEPEAGPAGDGAEPGPAAPACEAESPAPMSHFAAPDEVPADDAGSPPVGIQPASPPVGIMSRSTRELIADSMARARARRELAERLAEPGAPVRLYKGAEMQALAGPDASRPGRYRVTFLDGMGPSGHVERPTLLEAVAYAVSCGYLPAQCEPGSDAEMVRAVAIPCAPPVTILEAEPCAEPAASVDAPSTPIDRVAAIRAALLDAVRGAAPSNPPGAIPVQPERPAPVEAIAATHDEESTMAKTSPGPWKRYGQFTSDTQETMARAYRVQDARGEFVAAFVRKEDATMAAAAPAMLELLREYQKVAEFYAKADERAGDAEGAALKRVTGAHIRDLIATATGEA